MAGSDIIQSLARGMDVLVMLAEADGGLRVRDVAEQAGLKPSVAHNVLRTLRTRGFVSRDATAPVYRLGSRLEELVGRQNGQSLLARIEDRMVSLVHALPDATVTFTQPVNGGIVVRRRLSPDDYGTIQTPSGSSLALYASASGLAVLAFCSEDCYLGLQQRHPLLEEGAHIWSPPATLDAYLDTVRDQGYAMHPCTDEKRLAVAAPVLGSDRHFSGVLGISRTAHAQVVFDDSVQMTTVEHLKEAVRLAY